MIFVFLNIKTFWNFLVFPVASEEVVNLHFFCVNFAKDCDIDCKLEALLFYGW